MILEHSYPGLKYDTATLLLALLKAANHHYLNQPHMITWHQNSLFIQAIAFLISGHQNKQQLDTMILPDGTHPLLTLLSVNHNLQAQADVIGSIEIKRAFDKAVMFGVFMLSLSLEKYLGKKGVDYPHLPEDNPFMTILGACSLLPQQGRNLVVSLMHSPEMLIFQNTNDQALVDYDIVTDYLIHWLASGEHATDTSLAIVDQVLYDLNVWNHQQRPHSGHRSYPRIVHHVMMVVFHSAHNSSLRSLLFCIDFIEKVRESLLWDVGRFLTLRFISRFLDLVQHNMKEIRNHRDWRACRGALTYVYQWTLYRASSFGEYDISMPEFRDTLPPRDVFLARLHKIWLEFCGMYLQVFQRRLKLTETKLPRSDGYARRELRRRLACSRGIHSTASIWLDIRMMDI